MSSTSREKITTTGKKRGVQTHKFVIDLRLCVCVYSVSFVDLQSPTCIDFWTKFTHCSTRPNVRLALSTALRKTHYHLMGVFYTGTLLVPKNTCTSVARIIHLYLYVLT